MPEPNGRTDADAQVVIAVDVGGTGIKCALVTPDHQVVHSERHATGADRGAEAVVETILSVVEGLAAKAVADDLVPVAVGICIPGVVDEADGVIRYAANTGGMRNVPLRDLATARVGLPVRVGHDVRTGGLAEATLGAGAGYDQVLFIPIGTGIAAAHIVDGKVLAGGHWGAGEIGHIIVRPGGPVCGCGQRGCLEAMASASAVGRRYSERVGVTASAREVASQAAAGDPVAAEVWAETVDALADALLTAQALYDPSLVIIGGGLAEAGEQLLGPLRQALRDRIAFFTEPEIVRARLGDEAGCLGAALLALTVAEFDHPTDPAVLTPLEAEL
ncbi:MAG: ROK family protein [Hamadaea sp.]|nr:ROK family protein [Hamadaea sp.]NUR48530.1 ROK family protein [Hamadaea sp.]NUT02754.1 ROK family protein [Hamadaea sp.]